MRGMKRPVEKIDEVGNVLAIYRSMSHAARRNFMSRSSVESRCNGIMKHPFRNYDFTFRFKE